jgi:hypothetical protein
MTVGNTFSFVMQFLSGTRKLEYSYGGRESMTDQSRGGIEVALYEISAATRVSQCGSSLQLQHFWFWHSCLISVSLSQATELVHTIVWFCLQATGHSGLSTIIMAIQQSQRRYPAMNSSSTRRL